MEIWVSHDLPLLNVNGVCAANVGSLVSLGGIKETILLQLFHEHFARNFRARCRASVFSRFSGTQGFQAVRCVFFAFVAEQSPKRLGRRVQAAMMPHFVKIYS